MTDWQPDVDIDIDAEGMEAEEALGLAADALDEYQDACQCGLHKAIDIHDIANALTILTPSVAVCAANFRRQLGEWAGALPDAIARWAYEGEPPARKGLIDDALDLAGRLPDPFGAVKRIDKALRGRLHLRGLFPLSLDSISDLFDLIRESVRAFAYRRMGYQPRDADADIKRWRALGLLPAKFELTDDFRDAYEFSRFADAMDAGQDHKEMKRIAKARPLSSAELEGLEWHRANACAHIRGLANDLGGHALRLAAGQAPADWMKSQVREVIEQAKGARMDRRKLASELRNQTENYGRDWDRIAATEFANMEDRGRAADIRRTDGPDAWVVRIPKDTACPGCRKLYLNDDGTPRPYRLSELEANNTNADKVYLNPQTGRFVGLQQQRIYFDPQLGRFTAEQGGWLPVLGATHPNCCCVTVRYPKAMQWAVETDRGADQWPVTVRTDADAAEQWRGALDKLSDKLIAAAKARAERRRNEQG